MATIAEMLAAKAAKKSDLASVSATPFPVTPKNIGAAAMPGKKPGLTIKPEAPEGREADPSARRSLSTTSGEDVPPMTGAETVADIVWHSALQALDTELCVMPDSDARNERAWIAIRSRERPDQPLFLFALPFFPNPRGRTLSEPF